MRDPSGIATCRVRLCTASKPGSTAPPARLPLNVTIFEAPPSASSERLSTSAAVPAGPERATSGPYTDAVAGAAIGRFRLGRGEYRVVWSTYAPGLKGDWSLRIWADSVFDWERRSAT
jgi:calpain-7